VHLLVSEKYIDSIMNGATIKDTHNNIHNGIRVYLLYMGVESGGSEPGRFVATRQLNSNSIPRSFV